ncbi:signal recognition particle-docking protein FtsY [Candidatus Annandia adelgestsuga]|uniref:signal recognition particle-docking protein FtsY n=1 Tax=Candidatus Annandia adelgestsuga TaxID=1302411 RepID=UPI000F7EA92F|nr:signal recognition particle-docking protein FtsY [Candidatus Annandia adelgestsuga]
MNKKYSILNIFYKLKKLFIKYKDSIKYIFKKKTKYKNNDKIFLYLKKKLLMSDIGIETTDYILNKIKKKYNKENLNNIKTLNKILNNIMFKILKKTEKPLNLDSHKPFIILIIGVNGSGKTTTIGKLANKYKNEGKKVMLVAADTFRSSAIEQLKFWGKKIKVPVVSRKIKSDAASVVFDSIKSAKSKNIDTLIIDTAGIMHNKNILMKDLCKIKNVIRKINYVDPHEIILVLDSNNGQNSIKQTETFNKFIKINSLIINKLDITQKSGIIFPISHKFKIPIRYIGIGDKIKDIKKFKIKEFIKYFFLKNMNFR